MFAYRGVSVGTLDHQGLIIENRDCWNPKDIPGPRLSVSDLCPYPTLPHNAGSKPLSGDLPVLSEATI
jgi:hypothetical protein